MPREADLQALVGAIGMITGAADWWLSPNGDLLLLSHAEDPPKDALRVPCPQRNDLERMRRFARSLPDPDIEEELLLVLRRPRAHRSFQDAIRRHALEDAWQELQQAEHRDILQRWADEHHIRLR